MSPLQKIGTFGAALAVCFAAAYGVGTAVSPINADPEPAAHTGTGHGGDPEKETEKEKESGTGAGESGGDTTPGGLQISQDGYTLDLTTPRVAADRPTELRLVIRDEQGRPVTGFAEEHEKELHLIVASRDLTTFRHLHPDRAADGTWSTRTTLPEPGGYRVFADFRPAAEQEGLTLGADLAVSGAYAPAGLPPAKAKATVDGYEVTLGGDLTAGAASDLTFTVTRDGEPVTDLQPYLGAYGHLVALRSGDLAYLHVHPHTEATGDTPSGTPEVAFTATAPSGGAYRLFLDFKVDGEVRTAAFTVHADEAAASGDTADSGGSEAPAGSGAPSEEAAPHGH
ncbi:hypothetical protein AB0D49_19695 [Streptomyces sp. NPDC048290]|uniref:hypothetical protein n=1 Tax=Streptomyces sp. NPDC048290 TaxID=3155811 RepID=UPI00343DC7BD